MTYIRSENRHGVDGPVPVTAPPPPQLETQGKGGGASFLVIAGVDRSLPVIPSSLLLDRLPPSIAAQPKTPGFCSGESGAFAFLRDRTNALPGTADAPRTDMHKLTVVSIITLLALSSVSMAQSRKPVQKPRHAAASSATQNLAPEAAALRDAQKFWPNVPLCDDGGYRIRPCGGRGGG